MSQAKKYRPVVFISSTTEDLKPYRQAVRDAALRAKFFPEMQEYFAAEGLRPPLAECLKKVDECDLVVVIVAYRYGWIPEDQPLGDSPTSPEQVGACRGKGQWKSITWLECERARTNGKEVLAFLVDPQYDWPETLKEQYRLTKAIDEGKATPELLTVVQEAVKSLQTFKNWLSRLGIRGVFTTPQDLETKVLQSLHEWRARHASEFPTVTVEADPQLYLQWLHDECAHIDIRGLQVGTGKAHKFGIEELYIPLTTTGDFSEIRCGGTEAKGRKSDTHRGEETRETMEQGRRIELHQALQQKYVTIIGDPGAGKTTFLRRIAFALCQSLLKLEPDAAQQRLGLKQTPFPIFIRLGELSEHIRRCREQRKSRLVGTLDTDPTWLAHFLAEKSHSQNWGLSQDFFLEKFKCGDVMFLLDGLDEAPDRLMRETLSELVANAVRAYSGCPFVVTSRPKAYTGRTVLQDFPQVRIDPLEEKAMEDFLWHWSQALFYESPARAKAHHQELVEALRSRVEIRKMARNPVMLTALAVVHWNERRLPEQRAELYESIITWLLRSREQRPGRLNADQCGLHLQNLALAMQTHPKGRQVQVDRRWAAEAIQAGFPQETEEQRIAAAERFLTEEEVDSGVVVGRGNQIAFWHLTFQEYLAAKALGGKVEEKQKTLLVRPEIFHNPEWREVLLLFGGVLHGQGVEKVAGFFSALLDMSRKKSESRRGGLADEARCVGLIGAMLRDLAPFGYQLADPRYGEMLERVMAIFDRDKAGTIPLEVRLEAADALGQAGDPRLTEPDMVTIPESCFLMGAQKENPKGSNYDPDAYPDESPVHEVRLSAYQISRYLVTVAQYRRFVEDGGYENKAYWKAGGWGKFEKPNNWEEQLAYPNRPVVGVSWYEAMAYACWAGMELPTEAQWERAARGKSGTYRKFPWGNQPPDGKVANSRHTKLGHPSLVGMFPDDCTEEGVMDMGGNVKEWCRDWKDVDYDERSIFYKKSAGSTDPVNDETGAWGKVGNTGWTVVRGGSWGVIIEDYFRCAYRNYDRPGDRGDILGFRVVCSAQF